MEVDISRHGPLFDGRYAEAIRDYREEAKWEVGSQGLADVQHYLDASIRFPTPYYETQVMVERAGSTVVVHDRGIIYGPWLEGVGSRNRTTRFKGYFSFRKATAQLRGQAGAIAEHVLQRFLPRMGG